jgi:hypothetical protein
VARSGPAVRWLRDERVDDLRGAAELGDRRAGRVRGWQAGVEVALPRFDQAVVDGAGRQPAGEGGAMGVDQLVAGHGLDSSSAATAAANARPLLRSACRHRSPAAVSR